MPICNVCEKMNILTHFLTFRVPVVCLGDEIQENFDDVAQELTGVLISFIEILAHRKQRY